MKLTLSLGDVRYRMRTTKLRLPVVWFRHRDLTANDVFIASFPRSGNTWLRFLTLELLGCKECEFGRVENAVPYVGRHKLAPSILPSGGRLIKTHEHCRKEYKKAIYIIRDPRDVLVSYYHFDTHPKVHRDGLDEFVRRFVKGRASAFGSWESHVRSWLDATHCQTLLLRYEDLRENPMAEVARIATFLGVAVDSTRLEAVVADNDLEHMRKKEDRARQKRGEETTSDFGRLVRKGRIGQWQNFLTKEQSLLVETHCTDLLHRFAYPIAGSEDVVDENALIDTSSRVPDALF